MGKLALNSEVRLLHHGILHGVIDDVDARGAGAGQNESGKRVGQRWGALGKLTHDRIERVSLNIKEGTSTYFNRQRSSIKAGLQRLKRGGDGFVVNPIPAVSACLSIFRCVIEADARTQIIAVPTPVSFQELRHDRIDLRCAAYVLDVG